MIPTSEGNIYTKLHDVPFQQAVLISVTAMRTLNLTRQERKFPGKGKR
jgi:hypothetical protein